MDWFYGNPLRDSFTLKSKVPKKKKERFTRKGKKRTRGSTIPLVTPWSQLNHCYTVDHEIDSRQKIKNPYEITPLTKSMNLT